MNLYSNEKTEPSLPFKIKGNTNNKLKLPPYIELFDLTVQLTTNESEAREPYWNKHFNLKIVEALPGTWISKVTKNMYGDTLSAYDPAMIYLLTKEWAGFFLKHAKVIGEIYEQLPSEIYKKGNVPSDYDEDAFNPDEIFPGQRFFLLNPIDPVKYDNFDPAVIEGTAQPSALEKMWVGVGISEQTDWVVVGQHVMECWVHNMGSFPPKKSFWLQMDGFQFGPGFGVSGGLVLVIIHGVTDRSTLPNVSMGWDFEIAIGAKLTGLFKSTKFTKVARALTKTGKFLEEKNYRRLKYAAEAVIKNRDAITKPGIITLPIIGPGAHLWAGYKFGDVKIIGEYVGK